MALDSKIPNGPIADKWTNYKDHINLVNPANTVSYTHLTLPTSDLV